MYQAAYAEAATEAPAEARSVERTAIARSIAMMTAAEAAGADSREAVIAANFTTRLWTLLIDDLASPGNALPDALRAQLISVGLSLLRQVDRVRTGKSQTFKGAIDVSTVILEGLR
jgi:flagellar protein FlaF